MKFSYSAVWEDTVRLLRGHASLLLAVAGVFFLLPAVLIAYFLPQPAAAPDGMIAAMITYFEANWHWVLLANIANMVGAIAMLLMLFDRQGRTVGQAIAGALPILPAYFIASLLTVLIVGFGTMLLILPGIYLFGRIAIAGAVIVAEEPRAPLRGVRRAFALTKSRGWAAVGLIAIVALAGLLLSYVIAAVFGSLFLLAGGAALGGLLVLILNALTGAALSTLLTVLFAAIYRALLARESSAVAAVQ